MDPALQELIENTREGEEAELILRLHEADQAPPNIRVITQFGDIVTCRVHRELIREIWSNESIKSVKAPRFVDWEPPVEQFDVSSEVDSELPNLLSSEQSAEGNGVIVAALDWGIDFAHEAFLDKDGKSRLLAIWDQSAEYDNSHENKYGYGRIYSQREINTALDSGNPYDALNYHPAKGDPTGYGAHGTHVTSIAAGGGNISGIAPKAEIVFVHLAAKGTSGLADLGDSVRVLEGLDFVREVAGDKPWVTNLSLGRMGGAHDGTSLVEQGMDALILEAPGRAIVQSTGNYHDSRTHAKGRVLANQPKMLRWIVDPADRTPNELEIWYSGEDTFSITIQAPDNEHSYTVQLGESAPIILGDQKVGHLYHRRNDPNNHDNHVDIFLYTIAPPGTWKVVLEGANLVNGHFDAWIERDAGSSRNQSRFHQEDASTDATTGTIANGIRTIAVGAYDPLSPFKDIASFSSAGPTRRDLRQKPDLIAPGVRILAARSTPQNRVPGSGGWTRKSGTSMASPHVTGTVALMFEVAPRKLNITETREILLGSAQPANGKPLERAGAGYLETNMAIEATRSFGRSKSALVSHHAIQTGTASDQNMLPIADRDERDSREVRMNVNEEMQKDKETYYDGMYGDTELEEDEVWLEEEKKRIYTQDGRQTSADQARWANDSTSPDHRHLAMPGVSEPFPFSASVIQELCRLNYFDVTTGQDEVLFGLRGCRVVEKSKNGDFHTSIYLTEDRPDHFNLRCVLGVWKRSTNQVAVYKGSTVPNWRYMSRHYLDPLDKNLNSNMLPTGRYLYQVGWHKKTEGAFILDQAVVCRRTRDNLIYETTDFIEKINPADNIHPSYSPKHAYFSSAGCQTVEGHFRKNAHEGEWADFRVAAGLSGNHSRWKYRYIYTLFTGREARLIANATTSNTSLMRLRFGSQGTAVRSLQRFLKQANFYTGGIDGDMGPGTTLAFCQWQQANNQGASDGIVTPDLARSLHFSLAEKVQSENYDVDEYENTDSSFSIVDSSGHGRNYGETSTNLIGIPAIENKLDLPTSVSKFESFFPWGAIDQSSDLDEYFDVIGLPGERLLDQVKEGDILFRTAPAEPGLEYLAVLTSSELISFDHLNVHAVQSENEGKGKYALVVDHGSISKRRQAPYARLVLDSNERVPMWQLLVRPKISQAVSEFNNNLMGVDAQENIQEWNAHPRIHHHFHNGYQTYLSLRPLYQARGIQNPAQYLDDNIITLRFFGHRTPGHRDLRAPLQNAETSLRGMGFTPSINNFWAFVPRRVRGGTALSRHALGRAIDIDRVINPFINNVDDIRVIRAVTGVDLGQRQTESRMRQTSQLFQSRFNQSWINQQQQRYQHLSLLPYSSADKHREMQELSMILRAVNQERTNRRLRSYAQNGFLNLQPELINALKNAGFQWGGDWITVKDFMHFEIE